MGDEPSPPPRGKEEKEHEQAPEPEAEPEGEPPERYPFVDAMAVRGREMVVRAGWAEGEEANVVDLVYEHAGPAGSAATAEVFAEAAEWHAATLDEMQRRAAAERQRAMEEQAGEESA